MAQAVEEPQAWSTESTHAVSTPAMNWTASQAAAVAAAEAIAAEAAADVAAEAALTAQAAVDAALAASARATARAREVATRARLAAAAAARQWQVPETTSEEIHLDATGSPTAVTAAARLSAQVVNVAAAAATAVVKAQSLIREQLVRDEVALAAEVLREVGRASLEAQVLLTDPLTCAEELAYGIGAGQLRLLYQPVVSLVTGQPVGVEALVRWQHPEHGLLTPGQFVEVADNYGLALPLGRWVLEEACRTAATLQDRTGEPLTVAVNLSGKQLSAAGLVRTVQDAMDRHGCRADRLVFEVTETAMVTDMAAAVGSLRTLQQLGAGVSLDDFGTGYAPLIYLKHFAANYLKIDRSFIEGLCDGVRDQTIVSSLISLAHALGMRCVAEGVETLEQLSLLQAMGCDFAQGYLFCRPTDAASLAVWLDRSAPLATPSGFAGLSGDSLSVSCS